MKNWATTYAPDTIKNMILPKYVKDILIKMLKEESPKDLLFYGSSGTGKTSSAIAYVEEGKFEYRIINASLYNNHSNVKNNVIEYLKLNSIDGRDKVVIFDEVDGMRKDAQDALRGVLDKYETTVKFIFTANDYSKVTKAIKSRAIEINFSHENLPKEQSENIKSQMTKRFFDVLKKESVKYNINDVDDFIHNTYPDFRKILEQGEVYSFSGVFSPMVQNSIKEVIDNSIILLKSGQWYDLISFLRSKDIGEDFYKNLFEDLNIYIKNDADTIEKAIIIINKYYKEIHNFIPYYINISGALSELHQSNVLK